MITRLSPQSYLFGLLPALILITVGCRSVKYSPADEAKYVKPTVAVMSFENRAPVHTKWNLGNGLADQLIDRLMQTRRYIVLERARLDAILKELAGLSDEAIDRLRERGVC